MPRPRVIACGGRSTRDVERGKSSKAHGFALSGMIDPATITRCPPHAAPFFALMTRLMNALATRARTK